MLGTVISSRTLREKVTITNFILNVLHSIIENNMITILMTSINQKQVNKCSQTDLDYDIMIM